MLAALRRRLPHSKLGWQNPPQKKNVRYASVNRALLPYTQVSFAL
jgi:hypothetical protein